MPSSLITVCGCQLVTATASMACWLLAAADAPPPTMFDSWADAGAGLCGVFGGAWLGIAFEQQRLTKWAGVVRDATLALIGVVASPYLVCHWVLPITGQQESPAHYLFFPALISGFGWKVWSVCGELLVNRLAAQGGSNRDA